MKKNLPVTDREKTFPEHAQIVSSTDLKGVIRHANSDFVSISGFSLDELVNKSHNIVRHPDMPPAAFQNLWDTLAQGRPWMGIVKNRCKNGDYYWVDAFVTPVFEHGRVAGYESVRAKPAAEDIKRAESLYRKLWRGKGLRSLWPVRSLHLNMAMAFSTVLAAVVGLMHLAGAPPLSVSGGLLAGGCTASFALAGWQTRSIRKAAEYARSIGDNTAMQKVYTGYTDEGGELLYAIKLLQGGLRTVLGRIQESADELQDEAEQTAATTRQTSDGIRQQQSETELLATAMEEMSATVREVAQNTAAASDFAEQADNLTVSARVAVNTSVEACQLLEKEIAHTAGVIQRLEADSESIGTVVDVIRGIAEQTNLLALNAAIEAARAGEQGRGFAVVADEVRTLASRTQASTGEIQHMIASLQSAARESVSAMGTGRALAGDSVRYAGDVGRELESIAGRAARIKDMSIQIASAVEEQSAVSEEISRNVHNINDVADATSLRATATAASAQSVARHAVTLQTLVSRFGVI